MMVDAASGFAVAVLGVADARGAPALCVVAETSWYAGADGCRRAERQAPVELDGRWHGEPGASTPREPPTSPVAKTGTDVILAGHAVAPAPEVDLRIGPLRQRMRTCGDRSWRRTWRGIRPSDPAPWERIPLTWEHACGGGDGDAIEARNPLGRGFRQRATAFAEGLRLPNLEHPDQPLVRWGATPPPVGCAWTLPAFAHRRASDAFAPHAANAAAPELIAGDGLRGDETVVAVGVRPDGPWGFRLPAVPPPALTLACRDGDRTPAMILDTVLLDADAGTVRLTWRAWTVVGEHALVDAVVLR